VIDSLEPKVAPLLLLLLLQPATAPSYHCNPAAAASSYPKERKTK
jgi:hypothetical protein